MSAVGSFPVSRLQLDMTNKHISSSNFATFQIQTFQPEKNELRIF